MNKSPPLLIEPRRRGGRRGRRVERKRGTVIVAVLVMVVLLQVVVVALAVSARRESDLTVQRVAAARSLYAAESGVNMSLRELALGTDIDLDGTIGSISDDNNDANDPTLLGARFGSSAASSGGSTSITVRGAQGEAAREVAVVATSIASGPEGGWQGLYAEYFTSSLSSVSSLSQINWGGSPTAVAVVPNIEYASASTARYIGGPTLRFGVRFSGSVYIPADGTWTFSTNSDDGSDLWINGVRVVNNDGLHGMQVRSGTAVLTEGWHDFEVRFFNNIGGQGLIVSYSGPTISASRVIPTSAFRCAPVGVPHVSVSSTISLQGNGLSPPATIDSFSSSAGAYGGSNVGSNALVATNGTSSQVVRLTGGAIVNGSVSSGVGSNPASAISVSGGSQVTGTQTALTVRAAVPIIHRPSSIPASSGAAQWTGNVTVSSDRRYSSLQVSGDSTVVTISGHRNIYVDGDAQLSNASQVQIAAGSSLTLYLTGRFTATNTARVNMNTGNPEQFIVIMTGTNQAFLLQDGAQVCARVFNPNGPIQIYGTASPYASLAGTVAASSLTMTDRGSFHADNRSSGSDNSSAFTLTSWSENSP